MELFQDRMVGPVSRFWSLPSDALQPNPLTCIVRWVHVIVMSKASDRQESSDTILASAVLELRSVFFSKHLF